MTDFNAGITISFAGGSSDDYHNVRDIVYDSAYETAREIRRIVLDEENPTPDDIAEMITHVHVDTATSIS